jgi:outer membrane biosynthesis protein TonB
MHYWTRIGAALAASILLNLALLTALPHLVRSNVAVARTEPPQRSIRFDFSGPEPELDERNDPKQLIDAGAEVQGPVAETDLISSRDSQAQDNSDADGDPSKPAVDELDDFDQMPVPPSRPSEASESAEASAPAEKTEVAQEKTAPESETAPQPKPSAPPPPALAAPAPNGTKLAAAVIPKPDPKQPAEKPGEAKLEELTPKEPEKEPVPERFQVAQATPPAPKMPVQELKSSRGREEGGASNSGFTSFEANRHELGEYMLRVRSLVEREWRSALRIRYTGVSRTEAVIECSIRPDGSLEYARVLDPGVSLTYAVLCRQAIEQAAPFGPFPFDVPEIYRKDNLEITWKFSYL